MTSPLNHPAMTFVRLLGVLLIVLCLVSPGCEDKGENSVSSPFPGTDPSAYSYRAYTSAGALAVSGTLTLARTDSTLVTGTWSLEGVSSTDRVGPQIGNGTLAGTLKSSKISVDLNPGWRDNNVILTGVIEGEKIVGTWAWITFSGPTTNGAFEAVRKK
jgi:hypothetical protein